ncbi:hypothetical protein WAI453_000629 [Rhynchosporium graminicola]
MTGTRVGYLGAVPSELDLLRQQERETKVLQNIVDGFKTTRKPMAACAIDALPHLETWSTWAENNAESARCSSLHFLRCHIISYNASRRIESPPSPLSPCRISDGIGFSTEAQAVYTLRAAFGTKTGFNILRESSGYLDLTRYSALIGESMQTYSMQYASTLHRLLKPEGVRSVGSLALVGCSENIWHSDIVWTKLLLL